MPRLEYLLTLTPRETWRLVRRRLPVLRRGPAWTPEELLSSAKYNRGIRFAELLLRQEAAVRRHMASWQTLDFEDKAVAEIGCGPLAGFGPLAIFCGARSFASAEPEWNPGLLFSEAIVSTYLRVFHADLVGLYGPRMTFDEFIVGLKGRLHIESCGFEESRLVNPCDIVLSQSCLEHVVAFDATIAKLAAISHARTRSLHLVDFGNHYPTANPFDGLYEQPPEDYIARRGRAINLLRAPDVRAAFERQGLKVRCIPIRTLASTFRGTIHAHWRNRYDADALFTQLMLVAGPET